jgi:hypothetical protein
MDYLNSSKIFTINDILKNLKIYNLDEVNPPFEKILNTLIDNKNYDGITYKLKYDLNEVNNNLVFNHNLTDIFLIESTDNDLKLYINGCLINNKLIYKCAIPKSCMMYSQISLKTNKTLYINSITLNSEIRKQLMKKEIILSHDYVCNNGTIVYKKLEF